MLPSPKSSSPQSTKQKSSKLETASQNADFIESDTPSIQERDVTQNVLPLDPAQIDNVMIDAAPLDATPNSRAGKDELNLIEHPWVTLWKQESKDAIIEHNWEARHPLTGKTIKAVWRVEGSPQLGLPTASDLRVYLVLMELTRDRGFEQVVAFSRYELVKRLDWPLNQKSYEMLMNAFRRLAGVTISAQNAFWDSKVKSFRDVVFSIIDNVEIVGQKGGRRAAKTADSPLPLSSFRWNDVIFQSFKSGYLRTFDLGFALSLKGDISLSLYRYLGKKAYDGRGGFEIELETLYQRHLGLRHTAYTSKMKERLKPAHDELVGRGFLQSVSYSPMKSKKGEKVCYFFAPVLPGLEDENFLEAGAEINGELIADGDGAALVVLEATGDDLDAAVEVAPDAMVAELVQRMLAIGVSADVAPVFFETVPHEVLWEQLDCLSDRNPLNPAASFVSAVRGGWAPPAAYLARREDEEQRARNSDRRQRNAQEIAASQRLKTEKEAQEERDMAALDIAFESLPDADRAEIDSEVTRRLQFVVDHLGRQAAASGWQATRRQILREWIAEGREITRAAPPSDSLFEAPNIKWRQNAPKRAENSPNDQTPVRAPATPSMPLSGDLKTNAELDRCYTKSNATQKAQIEAALSERLAEANLGELPANHPGRLGVRRTLMRQMMDDGRLAD